MIRYLIFLLLIHVYFIDSQPVLFPHGWMESKNLRPRDAIMLNMMAQSNLEYGGVTLDELDKLDAVRKLIPRPPTLARDREEDDKELDREPIYPPPSNADGFQPNDGEAKILTKAEKTKKADNDEKKSPFRRVALSSKTEKRRRVESAEEEKSVEAVEESANPFEEIATRAPPRDRLSLRQLRKNHRKNQRIRQRKRKRNQRNGFLTRDDIIKGKQNINQAPSVIIPDNARDRAEFDPTLRDHAQETWERENKAAEKVREDMAKGVHNQQEEEPISPAIKMMEKEHEAIDTKLAIVERLGTETIKRLPNNPYKNIDISKPTILHLPLPPDADSFTSK